MLTALVKGVLANLEVTGVRKTALWHLIERCT